MTDFLNLLFNESDNIWHGSLSSFLPLNKSEFICINPLKSLDNRTDANVITYRNFLIEWDGATLEQQFAALEKLKGSADLNVTSAVYSGSKSLHVIFGLSDEVPPSVSYRDMWAAISAYCFAITGLQNDMSCKNPSRLSRMPTFIRPDTGNEQTLIYLGKLNRSEQVIKLVKEYGISSTIRTYNCSINNTMGVAEFSKVIKFEKGLYSLIKSAPTWASSTNMYPEIFKITLWAIDETGVPYETFLNYARQELEPHLLSNNYEQGKMQLAIEHAYKHKGLV